MARMDYGRTGPNDKTDTLYEKLCKIFVEHTTHVWKNGWQNEGDRESKLLTIQKEIKHNNLFLLQLDTNGDLELDGPDTKVQVVTTTDGYYRVGIMLPYDSHTYYCVDDDNWEYNEGYLLELCGEIYDKYKDFYKKPLRMAPPDTTAFELLSIQSDIENPDFLKKYKRKKILNEML